MAKKYYWLKLHKDFFKSKEIMLIENMSNGKDYIIFYLKLMLESIDNDGELRFNDMLPYNVDMLSVITNTNVDIVKAAIELFVKLQMMEIWDNDTFYMTQVNSMLGKESESANRMRDLRERNKSKLLDLSPSQCDKSSNKSDNEVTKSVTQRLEIRDKRKEKTTTTENIINNTNNVSQKTNSSISPESYYMKNFNPLITPAIADNIKSYLDDGFEPELFIKAMELTKLNDKPFSYALGIMRNCGDNNIKTLVQFNQKSKEFKQKKEKAKETRKEAPEAPDMSNYNPEEWRIPNVDTI